MTERPDYGIDAPGVVRNLAISGGARLLSAVAAVAGFLPPVVGWTSSTGGGVRIAVAPPALSAGVALCATALWMYFGSRYGKVGERERLLSRIEWQGNEQVLDVGCGRG